MRSNPIGIFDSGVGGLTIYEEIHRLLPNEDIIYLADSKNAPYGEKTKEEIIKISVKNTEFLLSKGCKLIVVACNTASTNAVKYLREHYELPFIRVQPAIKPAAMNSKTKIVGILATKSTLKSDLLFETSQRFAQGVEVVEQVGEGLVTLIESGKMHSEEMTMLLKKHIKPMMDKKIDHLVLGCTHYPFLTDQIEEIVGSSVKILDSGEAIARQTKVILEQEDLLNLDHGKINRMFYTNKDPQVMQKILDEFNEGFKAVKTDF
ncbi:glutamate racemase [Lutimonas zeaxanthinifaciens]|uniref:glutamate racemase n=1 Tax=Lutimonas zeaxanthinifaciens TaxID=3060215 RepID=UPI00265D1ECE|nr:glutamate racemase [Lutimonas sp. YSD2104]WKK66175.1 glutamate racemase [Lutimonas sp. YSD2104]